MKETTNDTLQTDSFFVLMASVFTLSLGYGIILPSLPFLLPRLLVSSEAAVAWHTGMLSGIYMFALFVFAPLWGRVSDRIGRRPVILIGVLGYVISLALFGLVANLWFVYAVRTLAGAFVSAVLPVTQAYVSETSSDEQRARRFAWMGVASLLGFLAGPGLSGWAFSASRALLAVGVMSDGMVMLPLYVSALLGLPLLAGVYFRLPEVVVTSQAGRAERKAVSPRDAKSFHLLLTLNFLVTFGLASFEVSLALQGNQSLGLDPSRVGIMFMECSLVMIFVQVVIFSTSLLRKLRSNQIFGIGFVSMTVGLVFLPVAQNYYLLLLLVALVAAGSGLLLPTLAALVSTTERSGLGAKLGVQIAAGSLGQAIGSAMAGWLFGLVGGATSWVTAVLMAFGFLVGLLHNTLVSQEATRPASD